MQSALVSLLLSGFGRDALKVAAGFGLVVLLVSAFVLSMFLAVVQAVAGAFLHAPLPAVVASFGALGGTGPGDPVDRDRIAANSLRRPTGDIALTEPSGAVSASVLALARAQLGLPYVWGGASPQTSFDCSGLVQWVYRQAGIALPRTAQQQFDATVAISRDRLAPGDLVFFHTYDDPQDWITHVGIYTGNGRMIDAESGGVTELPAFTGYWAAHYAGAGRIATGLVPTPPDRTGASGPPHSAAGAPGGH